MRRLRVVLSVATVFWVVGISAPAWGRPRAVVPTIAVSPSTELVGQQLVQVTGENWPANFQLWLATVYAEVSDGVVVNVFIGPRTNTTTTSDGSFSQSVKVKRVLNPEHDCAKLLDDDACALIAVGTGGHRASADLAFAPK